MRSLEFLTLESATKNEEYLNHNMDCVGGGAERETTTLEIVLPCDKLTVTAKASVTGK